MSHPSGEVTATSAPASLQEYARATLNILEDFAAEKARLEDTQRAMLNILEDFSEERARVEAANRDLQDAVESIRLARDAAEAANRELEAFAYSVSHDLRAPLRAMDGFSLALLRSYGDQLDARAKEFLGFIRQSSQTMAQLIDDLLSLSRVARADLRREPVEMSVLARQIVQGLQAGEPDRHVSFILQPDVVGEGDPRLLQQVLQNLLQNAWKFTAKHAQATIEFGTTTKEGRLTYYVRDDGAGFDPRYTSKLFGVFQRLHSTDEFEGTGIGLAIVQRIVFRHGGHVWAEGEIEKGAAFYFTL